MREWALKHVITVTNMHRNMNIQILAHFTNSYELQWDNFYQKQLHPKDKTYLQWSKLGVAVFTETGLLARLQKQLDQIGSKISRKKSNQVSKLEVGLFTWTQLLAWEAEKELDRWQSWEGESLFAQNIFAWNKKPRSKFVLKNIHIKD